MDAEFINLFLQKQKTLIDDLQQRLLLSETKLSLVEQKLEESNKLVDILNKKASKKVE